MSEENTNEDAASEEIVEEKVLPDAETANFDDESDDDSTDESTDDSTDDSSDDSSDDSTDDSEETKEAKKRTHQEKIDFAFSKKQKQLQEEKRLRIEAEERAAKYEQDLRKFQVPKRPEIPEMPDVVDPQYAQKLALREETIKKQVMYDQKMKIFQHQAKQKQQQQQQQRMDELKQKTEKYAARSKDFGISDEDAKKYEDSIAPFISPKNAKMAEYILDHEQGPLIVKYLSKNPMEMEKLASMGSMDAAVYISNTLSDKAKTAKPKTSKTPAPGKTLKGKGGTSKHAALDGAKFE